MAVNSISLGSMGTLEVYENGKAISLLTITEFIYRSVSSMKQNYYAGNAIPEGWQSLPHWTGEITLLVKGSDVDDFLDTILAAVQTGTGYPQVVMNLTESYSDGTSATWSLSDCQFNGERTQRGGQEEITKKLNFQAMFRQRIA